LLRPSAWFIGLISHYRITVKPASAGVRYDMLAWVPVFTGAPSGFWLFGRRLFHMRKNGCQTLEQVPFDYDTFAMRLPDWGTSRHLPTLIFPRSEPLVAFRAFELSYQHFALEYS